MLLRRYFAVHQCISLDETIQISLDKLHSLPDPLLKRFKDTVRVCCQKTSLFLNGKYYEETDDVAMGSPVGRVLAHIFSCYFEETFYFEETEAIKP